jgi:hypothetical protein
MFKKIRDGVAKDVQPRLRDQARDQEVIAWVTAQNQSDPPSDKEVAQFMRELDKRLPKINRWPEIKKLTSIWEAFMKDNPHFRLSDILHLEGRPKSNLELYDLIFELDLKALPEEARARVLTMANKISEAQEQAPNYYGNVFVQGFKAFSFRPTPLEIKDNKIRLAAGFLPSSCRATELLLRDATNMMALLTRPFILNG